MPRRINPRRSAPTYLTFDRGAWHLRFRYVDSIGRAHWPRERSPYPADYPRSVGWAPLRRAEIIAAIEAELRRLDEEQRRPITLGDVLAAYEADCIERGTRWDDEKGRARIILDGLGWETPAANVTTGAVMAWRSRLREERSLTNRSLNAYTTIITAAMNLAVRMGRLEHNPLEHLRRLPEAGREPPALTEKQVGALLRACAVWARWEGIPQRDRRKRRLPIVTRVLLGYYTGGRPEAIDGMTWERIDLERGVMKYESKGHRGIVCPLDPALLRHLRQLHTAVGPRPTDLVLPSPRFGGRRAVNWRPAWDRILGIANRRLPEPERIPQGTPLHALRHSRITHLLLAGVSPQAVAQVTGTSLVMLQRHYAHLMVAALEGELERARWHPALRAVEIYAQGHTAARKTGRRALRPAKGAKPKPVESGRVN